VRFLTGGKMLDLFCR